MRPDVICFTRGGIRRMGCAFSGHMPHCSPSLVDANSCSCKASQAHASSKCSWSGCHTASAGTMTEYVEHYYTNSQRGDTEHGVEDDSLQDGKVMTKTMMVIVMIMMLVIDGDGHRRWWWWWWSAWWISVMVTKMLHWWYAAVVKDFIKFDLHKANLWQSYKVTVINKMLKSKI